jgi:hypothetical protein
MKKKYMTKKNILSTSLIGSIMLFVLAFGAPHICAHDISCDIQLGNIIYTFSSFLPLFLFSLTTYFLREETFRSWVHFVYWWVPLSIFLTLITTESGGGGFGPQISWGKEDTAFVFSALFAVISLILIIVKSLKLKAK